ncbi:MAG: chemotaxis protein CheV [Magnetococcales bacterium]|nr:chemotaxis protein CheV [Magnetococcales bacterium]
MDNFMKEIDQRSNLAFSNQMEMLTFFLTDSQQYGINVFKIIEVIETPKNVTVMPQSHPAILGAINFREQLVTVIDLASALSMAPVDTNEGVSYVIICEYSGSIQGFLISSPNKLITRSWKDIRSPGNGTQSSGYLTALTYDDEGKSIQILDIEKVLGEIMGVEDTVPQEMIEEGHKLSIDNFHVMAVDDSRAARNLLSSTLEQLGVQHHVFDNAESAFAALEKSLEPNSRFRYCLIISDIEMPGMDGFTFTRQVKANPDLAKIQLVLHSSMSNQANKVKADAVGANDFIPKFQPGNIARVVLEQVSRIREQGAGCYRG